MSPEKKKELQDRIEENGKEFEYLFELQESGVTNMFGATPYLEKEMGFKRSQASEILTYWMKNYSDIKEMMGIDKKEKGGIIAQLNKKYSFKELF